MANFNGPRALLKYVSLVFFKTFFHTVQYNQKKYLLHMLHYFEKDDSANDTAVVL